MRIDSHQHFWNYDPIVYAWIDESIASLQRDFLPKDLKPILDANKIDGCIAVQADQSEAETEFLLKCSEENSFVKAVVGWVDLCADNVEERLAHFAENKKLTGVRHVVQEEPDDFMLREDFQFGISKLENFGLVYDILVYPTQLRASIVLANKFPQQAFILDHIAKPYIKDGKIDQWKKEIEELAKAPNVYCKISGMVTEADFKNWRKEDFTRYLDVVFNAFGIDRIAYGSDWPVSTLAAEYSEQLNIVEDYIADFSEEDKAKVMGGNAIKFYNLGE